MAAEAVEAERTLLPRTTRLGYACIIILALDSCTRTAGPYIFFTPGQLLRLRMGLRRRSYLLCAGILFCHHHFLPMLACKEFPGSCGRLRNTG